MKIRGALIAVATVLCLMAIAAPAFSQIEDVRAAIARNDDVGALRLLSLTSEDAATPDTYLYRGIAYANLKEFTRALDAFREGASRYPNDPRFHNEGLAFYRGSTEIVRAKAELRIVLLANPDDVYAASLLASLDLSDGSIEAALRVLNKRGQPQIFRILDNYSLTFSSSVISRSLAFHNDRILGYHDWKTTAARLQLTDAFSSVALEVEPSSEPGGYNAIVRTARKTNTSKGLIGDLLEGLPVSTAYVNFSNIDGSFAQFKSSYRWISSRRRAEGVLSFPLVLFGVSEVELGTVWRSELWDIPAQDQFRYKDTAVRVGLKHISDHRIEFGAGLQYELRDPVTNIGKLLAHAQYRPLNGRFKSQTRVDGFGSRASVFGNLNSVGATFEVANRLVLSEDHSTSVDVSLRGGTMRGAHLPVQDYFILGVDDEADYPLRGHPAAVGGIYGKSPMGTDFILANNDVERRIATLPYLRSPVLGVLFADVAKVFDRNRIYPQVGWLLDIGGGAKIEFKDTELVALYGRSVTDRKGALSLSMQRRFW